ncbi:MAG: hypothetical protein WKF57_06605 [Nakamurella sp.]
MSVHENETVGRTPANLNLDSDTIPLAQLPSRCPNPKLSSSQRTDPFWQGLWVDGAQASWLSRKLAIRLAGISRKRTRSLRPTQSVADAIEAVTDSRREHHLAALGAIWLWRTATAEQLAAITGVPSMMNPATMVPAFEAELVERGTFLSELPVTSRASLNHLYRPIAGTSFQHLADNLSFTEWMQVCAGLPYTRGSQHDRHNLMATELGLRIAEHCDVPLVLGEALSRIDLISRNDIDTSERRSADMMIVRPDGHRIAVEIVGSTNPDFNLKIRRWARLLHDTADDRNTGLSVLFLDTAGPERTTAVRKDNWRTIRATVGRSAYELPGAVRRGVPDRMAVARWEWWFPALHQASAGFTSLEAVRPTGPPADRWEQVGLLDPFSLEFDPPDPTVSRALIDNARHLYGVPSWLRHPEPPDFSSALLRRAGLTEAPRMPDAGSIRRHRQATNFRGLGTAATDGADRDKGIDDDLSDIDWGT